MAEIKRIFAPGKVLLLGEYAVLDGAPALVAAVHRGVVCSVETAETVLIEAPDTRFVGPALAGAPPGRYRFQAWNPAPIPGKAGFGSSAAATTAAVLAASALSPEALFRRAADIHREVQGSGSGVDVAASVFGGALRFQNGQIERIQSPTPVVIWSGQSALTGPRVERYLAWRGRASFVQESISILDNWENDPILALAAGYEALCRMARSAGIDYLTPGLEAIAAIAKEHGGAAKPSGAGGGDVAIALFGAPEAQAAFSRAVEEQGFTVIPVALARGATVETR